MKYRRLLPGYGILELIDTLWNVNVGKLVKGLEDTLN